MTAIFEYTTGSMLDSPTPKEPVQQKDYEIPTSTFGKRILKNIYSSTANVKSSSDVDKMGHLSLFIQNFSPVLQPLDVLDLYGTEVIGPSGLISSGYPSDHLAIAATFQMDWDLSAGGGFAVDSAGEVYTLSSSKQQWILTRDIASPPPSTSTT